MQGAVDRSNTAKLEGPFSSPRSCRGGELQVVTGGLQTAFLRSCDTGCNDNDYDDHHNDYDDQWERRISRSSASISASISAELPELVAVA